MVRFGGVAALLVGVFLGLFAAPAAASSQVAVTSVRSERASGDLVYGLRIGSAAGSTLVILPRDARIVTLTVDGVVRERVGGTIPIGSAALGHAGATLTLADERPADRVELAVAGSTAPLHFVDGDDMNLAHGVGFASGAYYAILLTLALFQLAALFTLRDPTIAWFLGFTLSLLGLEGSRDDWLPYHASVAGHEVFRTGFLLCICGFSVSYLRLRAQAPRLFRAAIVLSIVPTSLAPIFTLVAHRPLSLTVLSAMDLVEMFSLIAIASIRGRDGFVPATYLRLGLLGLPIVFSMHIIFAAVGVYSPLLNNWGLEFGSGFDVLAFSLAIVLRSRYDREEHERVRTDLDAATHAATHDELTGLANRRGLEASLERFSTSPSTVFFIDLDGFKAVNDVAGHAAGDAALKAVARILRRSIRSHDVAARVGGDEFVVVLVGLVERVRVAEFTNRITAEVSNLQPIGAASAQRLGVSIGSAQVAPGVPFSDAMARADANAYRIKAEHHAREAHSRAAHGLTA